MAQATAEKPVAANVVKVTDAGPAKKKLTITIPAQAVDARINDAIGTMVSEAVMPGFRKGKAPRALLEKRFGTAIREETKTQLVADAYQKAIDEHNIRPVSPPDPDESFKELKLEDGKAFTFSVDVEIVPDFKLPTLEGIQIKKPILIIEDKHIEEELERQQREAGAIEKIEDHFKPSDRLVGHIEVLKDGEEKPIFTSDQAMVMVPESGGDGAGQVLGLMIEGLSKLLAGKKVGDTVSIKTTGPEAHEREDIRGAKLTLEFKINEAHRLIPASMQQVIDRYQLENEDNLRSQVRVALEQRRDIEQESAMREQAAEYLIREVEFDLPEKLSAMQVTRQLERQRIELLYRGMPAEQVENQLAEMRAASESQVRSRLKLIFILHRLAEELGVQVTEAEVNGRIAAIAAQRGERPAALKAELAKLGRLGEVADQIREHRTLDGIVAKAKVSEIDAAEWNKMIAAQSAAGGAKPHAKTASKPKAAKADDDDDDDKPAKKKTAKK